ncbi:hypothetical protein MJ1HA_2488 [Metallosphaera sedula]|nr:hypothetical protein MJ1HA_2488 [Metallosphaera sedula]
MNDRNIQVENVFFHPRPSHFYRTRNNRFVMDRGYYLGAKYVILKLRERLITKFNVESYNLLEEELGRIEKELDLRFYFSEEQKKD